MAEEQENFDVPSAIVVQKTCPFNISLDKKTIATIHVILGMLALYLAWKCRPAFDLWHSLAAFFFPYLYIPYALVFTCAGQDIFSF